MQNESSAAIPEPAPTGDGQVVITHVVKHIATLAYGKDSEFYADILVDLGARAEMGKAKYGTYLRTHNGRNALNDLYQEILDGIMYAKQYDLEDHDTDIGIGLGGKLGEALLEMALLVKQQLKPTVEIGEAPMPW
jgi:hypothetical protein